MLMYGSITTQKKTIEWMGSLWVWHWDSQVIGGQGSGLRGLKVWGSGFTRSGLCRSVQFRVLWSREQCCRTRACDVLCKLASMRQRIGCRTTENASSKVSVRGLVPLRT